MRTNVTTTRLLYLLGIAYFAYATGIGLLFQKLVLPLVPGMHMGSGLATNDSVTFHEAAKALAQRIASGGWGEWSWHPEPGAMGNVGVLGALYYLFGPEPALLIPINAILHAGGAIALILLALQLAPDRAGLYGGVLVATLFVLFPSSLNWYGQLHKDGYAILGIFLYLLAWMRVVDEDNGPSLFTAALLVGGLLLNAFVRPHNLELLSLISLAGWVAAVARKRKPNLRRAAGATVIVAITFMAASHFARASAAWPQTPASEASVGSTRTVIPALPNEASLPPQTTLPRGTSMGTPLLKSPSGMDAGVPRYGSFEPARANAELSAALETWKWERSSWLSQYLDARLEAAAFIRVGTIANGLLTGAGSAIDRERTPDSAMAVAGYLPRALQIALFAPFPNQWREGRSMIWYVGIAEIAVWYLFVPGVILTLVGGGMRNRKFLLVASAALALLAIEGFVTPNVGTLHRVRYPMIFLLMLLGAIGWFRTFLPSERMRTGSAVRAERPPRAVAASDGVVPQQASGRGRMVKAGAMVIAITAIGYVGLFLRDVIMARKLGLGVELDAFSMATMWPMFLVNILAVPLGPALIPQLMRTGLDADEGRNWAARAAGTILMAFGVLAVATAFLAFVLVAKGIVGARVWELGLWMVPVVVLSGLVILANSILQVQGRAPATAAAQLVVPMVAIIAVSFWSDRFGAAAAVAGMALGQVVNLVVVRYLAVRSGAFLRPRFGVPSWDTQFVRQYLPLVGTALLSSAALPIGISMAARLDEGSAAALGLGGKIVQFFVGLVTSVLAAVVLPYFSRLLAQDRQADASRELMFVLVLSTMLGIGAGLFLFASANTLAHVLFVGGRLGSSDVFPIAQAIRFCALQLPFFAGAAILVKYSIADRKVGSVFLITVVGQIINIACSTLLMGRHGVSGIALGMSFGVAASAALLLLTAVWRRQLPALDAVFIGLTWVLFLATAVCLYYGSAPGVISAGLAFVALVAGESVSRRAAAPDI